MRIPALGLALALAAVALAAPLPAEEPPPAPTVDPALVEGTTAFALDLYRRLSPEPGNLFLSPHSVAVALAMAREGAAGATAAQIDAALRRPASGSDGFAALSSALAPPAAGGDAPPREPAYQLEVANALWGQAGFPFRDAFLARLGQAFGAGLERVDFGRPSEARARINAWVAERTRDRIRDIVPEGLPSSDTRLVLANAIYLRAAWAEPFVRRGTEDQPFFAPGGERTVPLMRRTARLAYAEDDALQVVEIPYRGGDLAMVVLVPRARDGLAALEAGLDGATFAAWVGRLQHRRVALHLPRFQIEWGKTLNDALGALGIRDAFAPEKADFSGMTEAERLFVGFVMHKAFVKVDEEGTEAAAATAFGMRAGSAGPSSEPVVVRADHPFLFAIRHRPTGEILFLGRLVDPR